MRYAPRRGALIVSTPSETRVLTVMTRNLYFGIDPARVARAATPEALVEEATQAFADVVASDVPARAVALAAEIAAARPHLAGLQEAALWRSRFPADFSGIPTAGSVLLDFVALLLSALEAQRAPYRAVAISPGYDGQVPTRRPDGTLEDIRLTDHEVILARADLDAPELTPGAALTGSFGSVLVVPMAGRPFTIRRGWASVDMMLQGRPFRFVSTHLEPGMPDTQLAQADELLQGPLATPLPVVLVGDFNSPADGSGTHTYSRLLRGGLRDAWADARRGEPGHTCCQEADLMTPDSRLNRRLDLVLYRGALRAIGAELTGVDPGKRTRSGRWPSDHAGVVARLEFL